MKLSNDSVGDKFSGADNIEGPSSIERHVEAARLAVLTFEPLCGTVEQVIESVRGSLASFNSRLPSPEQARRLTARVLENQRAEKILAAGYLPNRNVDWTKVDFDGSAEEISNRIRHTIQNGWDEIRRKLENDTDMQTHDAEGATVLGEALSAHDIGLYRAVVRLIMPEIERSVRRHFGVANKVDNTGIATKYLENAGQQPISRMFGIDGGVATFEHVSEHLYDHVRTVEAVARYAEDPIPNRHAAIHGVLPYSSWQSSVNAIFLLDFILVLTRLVPSDQQL